MLWIHNIKLLPVIACVILVGVNTVFSQDERCNLVFDQEPAKDYNKCLHVQTTSGVTVPNFVTRLGHEGLSVCLTETDLKDADIVYVMDISFSMIPSVAYVTASGDTLWFSSASLGPPHGTFNKPYGSTTKQINVYHENPPPGSKQVINIPRSNIDNNLASGSIELAGDPYAMRAEYLKIALRVQNTITKGSYAGFITFDNRTPSQWGMYNASRDSLSLVNIFEANALKSGFSTNYELPLAAAVQMIHAQKRPTAKPVIIFISDGAPREGNYLNALQNYYGDIYTIFLGTGQGAGPKELTNLANYDLKLRNVKTSSGFYSQSDPTDVKNIEALFANAIAGAFAAGLPENVSVINQTNGQVSTATGTPKFVEAAGKTKRYQFDLDMFVGLNPGNNQITIDMSAAGAYSLNIYREPAVSAQLPQPVDPFTTECFGPTTLEVANSPTSGTAEFFDRLDKNLFVTLTTSPGSGSEQGVSIVTPNQGIDASTVSLDDVSQSDQYTSYKATVPLNVSSDPKSSGDGVVDAYINDTLVINWCHPRDSSDCAILRIKTSNTMLANFDILNPGPTPGPNFETSQMLAGDPLILFDSSGTQCLTCEGGGNSHHSILNVTPLIGPTFRLSTQWPFKYEVIIFDHVGRYINEFKGEVSQAILDAYRSSLGLSSKIENADIATFQMTYVPITHDGIQLASGAYVFKMYFETLGEGLSEDDLVVNEISTIRFKKFGYVRQN